MIDLDLLLTGLLLGASLAFLGWRVASGKSQPACHPASGAKPTDDVVVGAALARGLRAAKARGRPREGRARRRA